MRSLSVPPGIKWTPGLIKALETCLVHVEHFRLESRGKKITENIWKKLMSAPSLVSLELAFYGPAYDAFQDAALVWPRGVRRLAIFYDPCISNKPFYRMLEEHNLDDLVWTCLRGVPAAYSALLRSWRIGGQRDLTGVVAAYVQDALDEAIGLRNQALRDSTSAEERKRLYSLFDRVDAVPEATLNELANPQGAIGWFLSMLLWELCFATDCTLSQRFRI